MTRDTSCSPTLGRHGNAFRDHLGVDRRRSPRSPGDHTRRHDAHVGGVRRPRRAHGRSPHCRRARTRLEGRPVHVQLQRVHGGPLRRAEDARRGDQCQLPLPRRGAVVPARQLRRRSDRVPRIARRPRGPHHRPAPEVEAARRGGRRPGRRGSGRRRIRGHARRAPPDGAHRATRGRHLHALHRGNDRHAEGRDVRRRRVDGRPGRERIPAARTRPRWRPPRRSPRR